MRDTIGNLPPLPGIFPDQIAPVVRTARNGEHELAMLRWGFPPVAKAGARPITNVRNLGISYWRGWPKLSSAASSRRRAFANTTNATQAPDLVRAERGPDALRLDLAALDRHARHQGQSRQG